MINSQLQYLTVVLRRVRRFGRSSVLFCAADDDAAAGSAAGMSPSDFLYQDP